MILPLAFMIQLRLYVSSVVLGFRQLFSMQFREGKDSSSLELNPFVKLDDFAFVQSLSK